MKEIEELLPKSELYRGIQFQGLDLSKKELPGSDLEIHSSDESLVEFQAGKLRVLKSEKELVLQMTHLFSEASIHRVEELEVEIEEGAKVSILEKFISQESKNPLSVESPTLQTKIRWKLKKGAKLRLSQASLLSPKTTHFFHQVIALEENAKLSHQQIFLGGLQTHHATKFESMEEETGIEYLSASMMEKNQRLHHFLYSHHSHPRHFSQMKHFAVGSDQSRSIFNGTIKIDHPARFSEAYLHNRNLLTSKTAVMETFPKLEIDTDEVKCAHGATVSPVPEDQLYYLESRGVSPEEARLMLIEGFLNPVVAEMQNEELESEIRDHLKKKEVFRSKEVSL